jgi:hypothetical protein
MKQIKLNENYRLEWIHMLKEWNLKLSRTVNGPRLQEQDPSDARGYTPVTSRGTERVVETSTLTTDYFTVHRVADQNMIMKSTPESVVSNSAPVKNQLSLFT